MKRVGIADLKSRLSKYLRAVQRGEIIAILDRQIPVARIVPVHEGLALRVRKPVSGAPAPRRIPVPKPLKTSEQVSMKQVQAARRRMDEVSAALRAYFERPKDEPPNRARHRRLIKALQKATDRYAYLVMRCRSVGVGASEFVDFGD